MDKVKNLNEDKKDTKNAKKEAPARPFMTPPAGKPLPKHMVQAPNGKMMPQGKPMKKSDVPQTKPKEEAAPTEAEAKKPVEAVQPAAPAAAAEAKGLSLTKYIIELLEGAE